MAEAPTIAPDVDVESRANEAVDTSGEVGEQAEAFLRDLGEGAVLTLLEAPSAESNAGQESFNSVIPPKA